MRVAVLFGGISPEHEVSLVSASSVIAALDKTKYTVMPIGITKDGAWLTGDNSLEKLKNADITNSSSFFDPGEADVIFPVLHGTFGEDGAIQGLLECTGIPYVGCGVLASAIGMDKAVQKQILRDAGLPIMPYLEVRKDDFDENNPLINEKIASLGMPVFVKPANMGSSIGVHKVKDAGSLKEAISDAFNYDNKILIEKGVVAPREIECAVLGNKNPRASVLGEVVSGGEFYDYNAKYVDGSSKTIVPADLSQDVSEKIKNLALKVFRALNASGCARVDFFLEGSKLTPFVNEINTMPGFTPISMFPKLWEASGLSYRELLDELLKLALENHKEKSALKRSYSPKKNWWNHN